MLLVAALQHERVLLQKFPATSLSDALRIYTHEVSLKLPKSRLSETTFFITKKASCLGEMC